MVMRKSLGQIEGFVGVDISEDWLDVHVLPSGERAEFSRDRRGVARLVAWLASKGRLLVVVEARAGGPGRGPAQPRAARLLPPPGCRRQSQEARADRLHAQAPGHPQRHAQGAPTMARTTTISLTFQDSR